MCQKCTGKAYQQESLCPNKEVCIPGNAMSKYITVMCCGSAFVNHTLILVAVRKAKEPQSFKGKPEKTELLSILTTREGYGWIGRHLKLDLQVLCSKKFWPS
jgi:hypothetical protein